MFLDTSMNLFKYIDMTSSDEPEKYGVVITEDEFFSFALSTNVEKEQFGE